MTRTILATLLLLAALAGPAPGADESWKAEFDRVCGRTDGATEFTAAQLQQALASCDALQPKIEALEETPRKVYLKRLQMCRNLFSYLLAGKDKPPAGK